jgi:hypothetical protein
VRANLEAGHAQPPPEALGGLAESPPLEGRRQAAAARPAGTGLSSSSSLVPVLATARTDRPLEAVDTRSSRLGHSRSMRLATRTMVPTPLDHPARHPRARAARRPDPLRARGAGAGARRGLARRLRPGREPGAAAEELSSWSPAGAQVRKAGSRLLTRLAAGRSRENGTAAPPPFGRRGGPSTAIPSARQDGLRVQLPQAVRAESTSESVVSRRRRRQAPARRARRTHRSRAPPALAAPRGAGEAAAGASPASGVSRRRRRRPAARAASAQPISGGPEPLEGFSAPGQHPSSGPQVHARDLRLPAWAQTIALVPEPHHTAGPRTPRPARTLLGRIGRDALELQPVEPARGVVAQDLVLARVDHVGHAFDGE